MLYGNHILLATKGKETLPMNHIMYLVMVVTCFVGLRSSATAEELHDAAAKGDIKRVKELIAAGADVNALDTEGNTSLNCACNRWSGDDFPSGVGKQQEVILALVDAGANVNAPGKLGIPAIFTAARLARLSVVKKLVEHGADLTFKTKKGSIYGDARMPLDLAESQEVWQYLRSKGGETGRTDFDKALCQAAKEGIPESVAYFLEKGGNPNAKFDDVFGEFRVMKIGGFNMPSLWAVKYRGMSTLHYACFGGSESVVRLLVEKGARLNAPDANGHTPLDFALFRGHKDVVSYLRSVKATEGVGGERMHIRAAIENLPKGGFHQWRACSLMPTYDFSIEHPDIKRENLDDMKGTAITFKEEWGGWDEEPVSFRNGMIGSCKAIPAYVKHGTEAKCLEKHYRFEKGNWVEVKKAEHCRITAAKTTCLDAKAIGYGVEAGKVLIMEVTLKTDVGQPSTLRWKQTIPSLKIEGRDIKASRLLIPNWLPMAGGVGPNATEMGVGGHEIGGCLKVDEHTWARWLAVDKPGSTTGDHISVPVDSVTVTVKKEKPVVLKLLFTADPSLKNAALTIPGCSPSSFQLAGPSEPKAKVSDARTQAFPPENELQKVIADACLADRPSLRGYTGIVRFKEIKPDHSQQKKFIVHADVTFVYFGTAMTLGYIDHFILSKNAEGEWNVEIVKKEQK